MPLDYIITSLPALAFGEPAPISLEAFNALVPPMSKALANQWADLDTQLRNAIAEARGGEDHKRPVIGCSLYWKNRVLACFQEKDVLKREEMLDKVRWDAAGELTPPEATISKAALATYAIRLQIALKRDMISKNKGNEAFDRLTAETKR